MGYKDHLPTPYDNSRRQYKETKRVVSTTFVANPISLTEQVSDTGIHTKTPDATRDFLQPLLIEIDNLVDNTLTTIDIALDKITAGFHRIQLPDVANVVINFLNCPINRVLDLFLDFTKENVANTPTVTFNPPINGLNQTDLDNNDRILVPVAARDTQDEVRFDAYGVSAGGGVGAFANQMLSNLVAPVAINQDLLFSATGFDIGDTTNPVEDIFTQRVRLQTGVITVNVPMLTANVSGDMLLNVDTNQNFIFHEAGVQTFVMNDTILTGPSFIADLSFALNDSGIDPSANGVFTRNSADVKVFSGGAVRNLSDIAAGGAANVFLSNLQSPTSINQDLLFSATGFDIGNTTNPVEDIFVERVRLQEGVVTVNVPMITSNANDDIIFNVPSLKSYIFREQNVLLGSIRGPAGSSVVDFDILEANQQLKVNETGVDPIVNGIFTLNAGRVKVFTNGILKDLTDIGTGGAGNQISQGDSNVTVTDVGAGQVDVTLDGTNRWRWVSSGSLRPVVDGDVDIGSNTLRVREFFVDRLNIQDDQASNNPPANATTITGDQGGMNFGVADNSDSFGLFFDGVLHYSFENDTIQFEEVGRQHRIEIEGAFLRLTSELETDSLQLQTGTTRTNETFRVENGTAQFLTQDDETNAFDIDIIQNNDTPATNRTIGALRGVAENSASVNTFYGQIEFSTGNTITSGSEDGRVSLEHQVGGSPVFGFRSEGFSGAHRIGFFNTTPVVQQNPAVSAAAIHAALQAYGLFV